MKEFFVWIVTISLFNDVTLVGNPPRIREKKIQIYGVKGREVQLKCPVDVESESFYEWQKDRETYDIIERDINYKVTRKGIMKIKQISKHDRGEWICRVTNGFGSVEALVYLEVIEEKDLPQFTKNTQMENHYPELYHKKNKFGSKPRWIDVSKRNSKDKLEGSSVLLKCKASAKPAPNITWFKNGKELKSQPRIKMDGYKLLIESLRETDSGIYTCIVFNFYGTIHKNFTLDVIVNKEPVITESHLVNTTTQYNETATFQCKVKSKIRPVIKWLKQVKDTDNLNGQQTFRVNNESYIVLKSTEHVKQENDFYLNKLTIRNVNAIHAGKYICWAANIQGYNFRSASLSVLGAPSQLDSKGKQTTTNDTIIIIIIVVVITMFSTGFCILYGISRYRTNSFTTRR